MEAQVHRDPAPQAAQHPVRLFRPTWSNPLFRWVLLTVWLSLGPTVAAELPDQDAAAPMVETVIPYKDGSVVIRSRTQTSEKGVFRAEGEVSITFRDIEIRADAVTFDSNTQKASGQGNIVFRRKGEEALAQRFEFDVENKTGTFEGLRGKLEGFRFATGKSARESENVYVFQDGEVTTCTCDRPHWLFSCRQARVVKDKTATLRGSVLRFFGIPVFYVPWVKFPILKDGRKTGLSFPSAGQSNLKGIEVSDSLYLVLGRSADATLTGEYYSKRGYGLTTRFRAVPSEDSRVDLGTYSVHDRDGAGGTAFSADAIFKFANGLRGSFTANLSTSMLFRQVWSDNFSGLVRPDETLRGDVARVWNNAMFHLTLDRLRLYLPNQDYLCKALPDFYVALTGKQLAGTPVWFFIDGRLSIFRKDLTWNDPGNPTEQTFTTGGPLWRADVHPSLFIPIQLGDYGRVAFRPSLRGTYYSDSLSAAGPLPGENDVPTAKEALFRRMATLEVLFEGPRLYRVWHFGQTAVKHVIEFGGSWRWQSHTDALERIIRFDSLDTFANTNEVEYYLASRWFGRRDGTSREWLSLTLRQKYFMDPDFGGDLQVGRDNRISPWLSFSPFASSYYPRRFTPLQAVVAFAPARGVSGEIVAEYDSAHKGVNAWSASTTLSREWLFTSLAFIRLVDFDAGNLRNDYIQSSIGVGKAGRGLSAEFNIAYNLESSCTENIYLRLNYATDCLGFSVEYIRYNLASRPDDNEFRFSLFVRGLGEFGPLRNLGRRWY